MTTSKGIRESWSHSLYLRRKTSRRGEMDVQILRVRIGELPFDSLFQPDALDHFPAGHHCRVVTPAHRERAPAQLVGHGIDGVEGFLALTHIDRKAHPVWRGDRVMLVVDQNDFVARRCIGKTDAARAWTVRDFPERPLRRQLCLRKREEVRKLSGLKAANAEVQGRPPLLDHAQAIW